MRAKKYLVYGTSYFFLFSFSFLLVSCDSTEPPPVGVNLKLTEIDKAVKETYLHLSNTSGIADGIIVLTRNGTEILSFSAGVKDTIVTDTALTQNTTYKYEAVHKRGNEPLEKSSEVIITTLMPTSHEIDWEEYYFGDAWGIIWDVSIIDENNIWAVGEVYMLDSTGQREDYPYNLFKWDGHKWTMERIFYYNENHNYKHAGVLNTIYSFGLGAVYVCSSANLLKWDGKEWPEKAFFMEGIPFTGQVTCMWGKDENNIYFGSINDGSLYYYYGTGWRKLQYPTITNAGITDLFGFKSPIDNKWTVLASISNPVQLTENKIIKIDNENYITELPWINDKDITGIWTKNGYPIYACGGNIYEWKNKGWSKINGLPAIFLNDITGSNTNDIIAVGDFNYVAHYNGENWALLNTISNEGGYTSVKMKDNMIILTGDQKGKGYIKIGRR